MFDKVEGTVGESEFETVFELGSVQTK